MQTIYELPPNLEKEIIEYENLIHEYENEKIDKQKLRAHRVPMGVYEQRIDDTFMVRVRIPGGNITVSQFKELINIVKKYSDKDLHITTRQEIQLHNIKLEDTAKIMKELLKIGLSTRGGGGNTVRNIIGSHDSGISENEIFDITPYVVALTERMIQESDSWTLPRKFKIAFSNGPDDTGYATVNDLGFIAKINEKGEKGFAVYIAGGMGANSNVGIKIFDFVSDKEVYNIAKSAKNLFDKYGNRKNRHKARLRFVLYSLGREEFIKKFFEEYEKVKKQNFNELKLRDVQIQNKGFIEIPIFLGDLSFENAEKILSVAQRFGENSLRFTPRQNIIIKNIPEKDKENIKEELIKNGLIKNAYNVFLYNAVSCAGASTCRLGICLSKNLLKAIKDKFEQNSLLLNLDDLKINISGCPNSCGQHLLADIGFFGKAKKINGKYVPFYYIVAGAEVGEDKTKFAEKIGEIAALDIP
ncbi:MAG: nitrite/sulfite reductase, partial [Candidatus Omnitrophica bacterium]|nr:nitrite/sulfite reductase [Candidatus Omnitrophota bacterium]